MSCPIHIVDVFAQSRYAGNQLAVVIANEDLPEDVMLRIAAEMNYSETTFVSPQPDSTGAYPVRMFTPAREVAFAGHPILGTAWVVRHHLDATVSDSVRLKLPVGEVPVTFERAAGGGDTAWFLAPPVTLGATCLAERMAQALGISAEDIETKAPVQTVSARTSALIVPLRSLDALRRSRLDLDAFAPLAAEGFPPLIYLFCSGTRDRANDLSARFFFEANGVREDPATGNGAAFLGAYLRHHQFLGDSDLSLRIEQGHEMGRPSLVLLRVRGDHEIRVGGNVIPVVQGELVTSSQR